MLLQGIPEQIGVVTLACAIAGVAFQWKKIIPMGIFLALAAYFLRLLNLPFGSHTIVLVVFLLIFLIWKDKKDLSAALVSSLVSYVFLIVFETVSISILIAIFDVSPEDMFSDPYVRILFTEPQVILIFITTFLIWRVKGVHDKP